MMNAVDTTHVTNTPIIPMTMHTLAYNNFQNNNNNNIIANAESNNNNNNNNKIQDYYNLLTLEDPIWYNIPEMISLGGLSADARERLVLAFNILYKPEEFGYIISPITGKRELIFFASTQRVLSNNIDSLLLGGGSSNQQQRQDNNNNNSTLSSNKNNNHLKLLSINSMNNNNNNTTQPDFLPSIYHNHIQQHHNLDKDSTNNNEISILPDFPSLFGKTLGINNILQTRDVTLPVQPFSDNNNSSTSTTLGQPPDLRLIFDSMNNNNNGDNDDFITPFAANPQKYGMLGSSIPKDKNTAKDNQDDTSFGFVDQDYNNNSASSLLSSSHNNNNNENYNN
eukprot:UN04658